MWSLMPPTITVRLAPDALAGLASVRARQARVKLPYTQSRTRFLRLGRRLLRRCNHCGRRSRSSRHLARLPHRAGRCCRQWTPWYRLGPGLRPSPPCRRPRTHYPTFLRLPSRRPLQRPRSLCCHPSSSRHPSPICLRIQAHRRFRCFRPRRMHRPTRSNRPSRRFRRQTRPSLWHPSQRRDRHPCQAHHRPGCQT